MIGQDKAGFRQWGKFLLAPSIYGFWLATMGQVIAIGGKRDNNSPALALDLKKNQYQQYCHADDDEKDEYDDGDDDDEYQYCHHSDAML